MSSLSSRSQAAAISCPSISIYSRAANVHVSEILGEESKGHVTRISMILSCVCVGGGGGGT